MISAYKSKCPQMTRAVGAHVNTNYITCEDNMTQHLIWMRHFYAVILLCIKMNNERIYLDNWITNNEEKYLLKYLFIY